MKNSNINKLERKINKLTTVEENSIVIFSQSLIDQANKNLGKKQINKFNLMLKKRTLRLIVNEFIFLLYP